MRRILLFFSLISLLSCDTLQQTAQEFQNELSRLSIPLEASTYNCEIPGSLPCSVKASNYENVTFYVDSVSLGNGKMRWHLSFWNKGKDPASMAMGWSNGNSESKSYLNDDRGNQYKINKMSPDNFLSTKIPAGVKNTGYIEFDTPDPQAELFTLNLNIWTYGSHQLRLPTPTLTAKLHQESLGSGIEKPLEAVVQVEDINSYDCLLSSSTPCAVKSVNYGDVTFYVDSVEIEKDIMRWHISFWNKGDKRASMAMGGSRRSTDTKSYLTDELGTQYKINSMSPDNFLSIPIPAGVKNKGYIQFDAPAAGAKIFTLHLNLWTFGSHQLRLPSPTVAVQLE